MSQAELWYAPTKEPVAMDAALDQWMTPAWVAEALLERHFPDLGDQDMIVEPGCGTGRWLRVIRRLFPHTRALGVEIDPKLAEVAQSHGCNVLVGDFGSIPLPVEPTVILGNWPFSIGVFERFLTRAHGLLPDGGLCRVLTSSRTFQATSRVIEYATRWSIAVECLPRDMFPGLQDTLVFSMFRKDRRRVLVGLGLYAETAAARALQPRYRALIDDEPTTWRAAVEAALTRLGGCGQLQMIYAETTKPTDNQWWKEKIRQILQMYAVPLGDGVWSMKGTRS